MTHNLFTFNFLTFLLILISFTNCGTFSSNKEPVNLEEIMEMKYAQGLSIYRTNEGYVVTISNPTTKEVLDHFLVTKSDEVNLTNIKKIQLPINHVLAYSSTYISFLEAVGKVSTIKGVTYSQGISNPIIKKRLISKETVDVGSDQDPDKELVVSLNPDLALVYPSNGNHDWFSAFDIPTITNVEYLEIHPLAKAEWLKLYGVLFDKVELALKKFEEVEEAYNLEKNINQDTTKRPVVLCGELYNDVWALPGGRSITAQLISDAGGTYFYQQDSTSGSKKLDFEYILSQDSGIDFWLLLTYNQQPISYSSLKTEKPRYSYLSVFSPEKIGYCNTATTSYFETGILEPHILLKEIKNLIHHIPIDSTKYFKPLPNE